MSILNNYKIIREDTKDFYNDIFSSDIIDITKRLKTKVKTEKIFGPEAGSIKNDDKEKHKEIMISNYTLPIAYLIYSYIYIKFYNNQFKNQIIVENKLNYEMYKFVFSHKNPIIREVNIFLYKNDKDKKSGNKKIDFTVEAFKNATMKDQTIKFLEEMNKELISYNEDLKIFKNILNNLNKAINKIDNIGILLVEIHDNFRMDDIYEDRKNIYDFIDLYSPEKYFSLNPTISQSSRNSFNDLYNNFITLYLELIQTNIKTINIDILKLSTDNIKYVIHENDIKYYDISVVSYTYFNNCMDRKQKEYDYYKKIINYNIELNNYLKEEKKLINLLNNISTDNSNKKSVKKIKSIIDEIKNKKQNLIHTIYLIFIINDKAEVEEASTKAGGAIPSSISPSISSSISPSTSPAATEKAAAEAKKKARDELKRERENISKKYIKNQSKLTTESNSVKINKNLGNLKNQIKEIYKEESSNNLKYFQFIYRSITCYEIIEFNYIFKKNNTIEDEIFEFNDETYINTQMDSFNKLFNSNISSLIKKNKAKKRSLNELKDFYIKELEELNNENNIIEEKKRKIESKKQNITSKRTKISSTKKTIEKNLEDCKKIKGEITRMNRSRRSIIECKRTINSVINRYALIKDKYGIELNKIIEDGNDCELLKTEIDLFIDNEIINKQKKELTNIESNLKDPSLIIPSDTSNERQNIILETIKNIGLETNINNTKQNYFSTINKIIQSIDSEKLENEKNLFKNICENEFNILDTILKEINKKIEEIDYNKIDNKLYFLYKKDDIYTIYEKYFNNTNNIYENLKKSKLEKSQIKSKDTTTLAETGNDSKKSIIEELNKYFIENKEDFYKKFKEIFNSNENNNLNPFLEQFTEYKDNLVIKINILLDKINNEELKLKEVNPHKEFTDLIAKKKLRIAKIKEHEDDKIVKNGKYTKIIPSTDVLFLYIIHLLIIIDFLTTFYE